MKLPTIAWSDFALARNLSYRRFKGEPATLLRLVRKHWHKRVPGAGRTDRREVVVVPIHCKEMDALFASGWIDIKGARYIRGKVAIRQEYEDPYIQLMARGRPLPTRYARVVLYSADTLLKDGGRRSSLADWEVVAILTGPWESEPMDPLTMARNYLRRPGGTYVRYSAAQFAESIYFWSGYVQKRA